MRPWSLLFTLYGDPIRYYGGEVSISGLIRIMAEFGFSEGAVRAAVHRMSQQEWLVSRRVARASYYKLSDKGVDRLEEAAKRIYAMQGEPWDGRWRLLNYSIPESHRSVREKFRKEMAWLGYGTLSANLWVTPFDRTRQVRRLLDQYDLQNHVHLFAADNIGPHEDQELVRRSWDLQGMKALYQEFIQKFEALFQDAFANGAVPMNRAFVLKTLLVHEYRKFLFLDPGLPDRLLEEDWTGRRAAAFFRRWYLELHEMGLAFFEQVCGFTRDDAIVAHPFLTEVERTVERGAADEDRYANRTTSGSPRDSHGGDATAI